jgi:hypothetical protein
VTANVEGLTAYVRARQGRSHHALIARARVSGVERRGTLEIDRNIRAGRPQTRVVLRPAVSPDVVLSDRLIAGGAVEIKVGRRYLNARDVLAGVTT